MAANLHHQRNVDIGYGATLLLMAIMLFAGITTGEPLPFYLRVLGMLLSAFTAGLGLGAMLAPHKHVHINGKHYRGRR